MAHPVLDVTVDVVMPQPARSYGQLRVIQRPLYPTSLVQNSSPLFKVDPLLDEATLKRLAEVENSAGPWINAPKGYDQKGALRMKVWLEQLPPTPCALREILKRMPMLTGQCQAFFVENFRGSPQGRDLDGTTLRCPTCSSNWAGLWVSNHAMSQCPWSKLTVRQRVELMAINFSHYCPLCGSRSLRHDCVQQRPCAECRRFGHTRSMGVCRSELADSKRLESFWKEKQRVHYERMQELGKRNELCYRLENDYPITLGDGPGFLPDRAWFPLFPPIKSYIRKPYVGIMPNHRRIEDCLPIYKLNEDDIRHYGKVTERLDSERELSITAPKAPPVAGSQNDAQQDGSQRDDAPQVETHQVESTQGETPRSPQLKSPPETIGMASDTSATSESIGDKVGNVNSQITENQCLPRADVQRLLESLKDEALTEATYERRLRNITASRCSTTSPNIGGCFRMGFPAEQVYILERSRAPPDEQVAARILTWQFVTTATEEEDTLGLTTASVAEQLNYLRFLRRVIMWWPTGQLPYAAALEQCSFEVLKSQLVNGYVKPIPAYRLFSAKDSDGKSGAQIFEEFINYVTHGGTPPSSVHMETNKWWRAEPAIPSGGPDLATEQRMEEQLRIQCLPSKDPNEKRDHQHVKESPDPIALKAILRAHYPVHPEIVPQRVWLIQRVLCRNAEKRWTREFENIGIRENDQRSYLNLLTNLGYLAQTHEDRGDPLEIIATKDNYCPTGPPVGRFFFLPSINRFLSEPSAYWKVYVESFGNQRENWWKLQEEQQRQGHDQE